MPTRPYLSRSQYSTLKSRLTRAKKKGPGATIREVRHAVTVFDAHVWPDDWARWERALSDCHRSLIFFDLAQLMSLDQAGLDALISRVESDTDR